MNFLVKYVDTDDGHEFTAMETASEIFNKMDMDDCCPIRIAEIIVADPYDFGERCEFLWTWHDSKDPLKMVIRNYETELIYAIGYGTDH